jgi:hypothetical protein
VALAASLGFLVSLGSQGIDPLWVAGLLGGGLVAAPIAAWLVRYIPPRMLGSLVGGIIVLTNVRTLLKSDWLGAGDATRYAVYAVLSVVWAAAVIHSYRQYRRERAIESADAIAAEAAWNAEVAAAPEANVVADLPLDEVRAGRPSAPQG